MRWLFRQAEFLLNPQSPVASKSKREREENADVALTAWCVEAARLLRLSNLEKRVRVQWNARMRTTAGRAWWPDRLIELNPKLLGLPEKELWRTLKHELAHLVAYERAGRRRIDAHGDEWRQACADLGIPGESAYHNLPFQRRRMKRKFQYACPSCNMVVPRVRKITKPLACYACCKKHNGGVFDSRFRLREVKDQAS